MRPVERRLARTAQIALVVGGLALASLVPAALLAPPATTLGLRLALPFCGLAFALWLCAALLFLQGLCAGRAEGVLVGAQTLLVTGVVVGLVAGLRHVAVLARLGHLGDGVTPLLWLVPQAWCAAPLAAALGEPARAWLPALVGAASLVALALVPPARKAAPGRREALVARLLRPARALATRWWVRPEERAAFDLVYDALPREPEVVLRTYPMLGIPLAFLVAAALGEERGPAAREGLLALLLFTSGVYLPVLLTQVPASRSAEARWLFECSPVRDGELATGALKAVLVRFLLPLYLVLGGIAWAQAGARFALTVTPLGALAALFTCLALYPVCVRERPLSVPPDELRADLDWLGVLGALALVATLASVLVQRFLRPASAILVLIALVPLAGAGFARLRRRYAVAGT